MSLLDIIKKALEYITGLKTSRDNLKAELDKANETIQQQAAAITTLNKQHDADAIDDQELSRAAEAAEKAAREATERADALQVEIDATKQAADELSSAINENPETPNVGPELNVIETPSETPSV